jgi:hypothetical protein
MGRRLPPLPAFYVWGIGRYDIRPGLSVGQETTNLFHITGADELVFAQAAVAFGALFRQNMVVVRFAELIFSAAGFFEPFGCGSVGFNLWHCLFLLYLSIFPARTTSSKFNDSIISQNKTDGVSAHESCWPTP